MTLTITLVALLTGVPTTATSTAPAQPSVRGACEYTSDDPAKKGLSFCSNVASGDACTAEAARKVSAAWLEKHPAKFTAGVDCKSSDKRFKKAKRAAAGARP